MHAQEIASFAAKVEQKGLTVVPSKLYLKHGKIKVELALGRGRKLHDHRVELESAVPRPGICSANCADNDAIGKHDGKGRFRSASTAVFPLGCSRDGGAYDGGGVWKAPLISRKREKYGCPGPFA